MDILRSVNGDADEEAVGGEEVRPFRSHEGTVGLKRVMDDLAIGIFTLQRNGFPIEVNACQQWLSAVPVERDLGHIARADVVADDFFEELFRHYRLSAAVKRCLVQIVAVAAIQIAQGTGGLEHYVEGCGSCHLDGIRQRYRFLE